jgi:hypothetical protein
MKLKKLQASLVLLFYIVQYVASITVVCKRTKDTRFRLMTRVAGAAPPAPGQSLPLQRPALTLRGGALFLSCDAQ